MTTRMRLWMGALTMVLLGGVVLPQAEAQCGGPMKTRMMLPQAARDGGRLLLAGWSGQAEGAAATTATTNGLEPIVGLWKTDFEDPAAGYSDHGYQTWHSDFTEFLNSGRPPSIGSVCEGVWEKAGPSTYSLNHFAMAFADGVHLSSIYQFRQTVTVDATLNHFSGTFRIEAYDAVTYAPQGGYQGTVTGNRVRIGSSVNMP